VLIIFKTNNSKLLKKHRYF